MRLHSWAQTEPPGDPREMPWPDPAPPPSEPPGDPREEPWPDREEDEEQ